MDSVLAFAEWNRKQCGAPRQMYSLALSSHHHAQRHARWMPGML